jgi:glycosyltransferase involved in cell wall biosynthesis
MRAMRIALLGGVFGSPMGRYALSAPENVLLKFLGEAGHEVLPLSISEAPRPAAPPDVWHANHFGAGAYHLAFSAARPLVFTSHNPFLVSDYPVVESRLERMLQALLLRRADAVVALSSREADLLAARFGIARERFTVIPNGLDLALYEPAEPRSAVTGGAVSDAAVAGAPAVPLDIVAVGQLVDYKGHRYLLEAVARLRDELPGLRLTIVTHQAAGRAEQERLAAELGIADRLAYEGPYSTAELAARIRRCDVFVQPSLAECFPVTVLEAMACAVPVVATDVGGVAEEIGDAGVVVPPADAQALTAAIRRLAADPGARRALGATGRARVEALYDGRRVAALHAELYTELASRGRRAPRTRRADVALALYANRAAVARLVPTGLRKVRSR